MSQKRSLDVIVLPPGYLDAVRNMRSVTAVAAEAVFSLVPIVVLSIVVGIVKPAHHAAVLAEPEWSFLSAVLFGQAIAKLVAGTSSLVGGARWETATLTVALLFCFGVVPSLVVLVLVLVSAPLHPWLPYVQLLLFILALASFVVAGSLGHSLLTMREQQKPEGGA